MRRRRLKCRSGSTTRCWAQLAILAQPFGHVLTGCIGPTVEVLQKLQNELLLERNGGIWPSDASRCSAGCQVGR